MTKFEEELEAKLKQYVADNMFHHVKSFKDGAKWAHNAREVAASAAEVTLLEDAMKAIASFDISGTSYAEYKLVKLAETALAELATLRQRSGGSNE